MNFRTTLLTAAPALLMGSLLQAQSTASGSANGPPATATEGLEEIVITAERRPERLDRVPVAASVVSASRLDEAAVSTINSLGNLSPSLTVANQQALSYVNIRGVGLQATNPTTSSGVAIYTDGFFIPHEVAIADQYYDIDQVEVLRGPQGTLVGQSSTGGAIFINSVKPSFSGPTGFAEQTVGNFGLTRTQGAYNAVIAEGLALRVAGNFYNRDSYFHDLHVGGAPDVAGLEPGNAESFSGRVGLRWQPSAGLDVYLKYETTTRHGDGYAAKNYGELAGQNNSIDPGLSQPWNISYDQPSWDKYRSTRLSSEITWDIADGMELRSLTGYQHNTLLNQFDNDDTPLPLSWANQSFNETDFEQEFDLISKNSGPLNWIVGAFYLHDRTPTNLYLYTAPPGPPPPFTISTQPRENSYAIFGQLSIELGPKWQLLLGGRENRDEKTQSGSQTLQIQTGLPAPAPPVIPVTVPLDAAPHTTSPTGKAALSYFPTADSTAYISASRGFKAGGANAGDLLDLNFKPETINAYEAGYKASFMDRHLSVRAAGFYYDYRDMQVSAIDASGQNAIINVPRARLFGTELELAGQVGGLAINGGVGFDHSRVSEPLALVDAANPFAGEQQLEGRQLPYAPKWTGNLGATYSHATPIGQLAVSGQYSYASTAWATLFQDAPRDLLGSHHLFNATLGLTLRSGIHFELYGANLNNALYASGTLGVDSVLWGPPREYGARLGYAF